ncbi:hypothetical protein OUZ56_009146 [Daphnia magna]|uniref:Uncharacterized protein n=1 Tax=Daphnia magna TaxID=35525 RepID=A0ABR0AF50_9CRUS|nr:hypothetical protein OUZ56_009146 [Daphnia magna]
MCHGNIGREYQSDETSFRNLWYSIERPRSLEAFKVAEATLSDRNSNSPGIVSLLPHSTARSCDA